MDALIHLLILVVVFGLIFWLVDTYLPIPEPFKLIVRIIMVLIAVFFLLQLLGVGHMFTTK